MGVDKRTLQDPGHHLPPIMNSKWTVRVLSVAIVVVLWQIIAQGLDPLILPTPVAVYETFLNPTFATNLVVQLSATLSAFALGFGIGAFAGIVLGAFMARWNVAEQALLPYVNAFFATPYIAFVPLITVWFGTGVESRLAVVILSVVFIVTLNAFAGFRNMSRTLVETGRSFGFSGLPLFSKVVIPGSLPYIVTGLRLGIAKGLVGVIVAELFVRIVGVGYLIMYYSLIFQVANVFAIMIVLGVLGMLFTETLKRIEGGLSTWQLTATGG